MNEIKEILRAVQDDGLSDGRLAEIREIYGMLGKVLDSAQSEDGLTAEVLEEADEFVTRVEGRGQTRQP